MTTTSETKTTVEKVQEGQTVRLTGGALFTVSHVRREAGYTYLYERFSDAAPYALPDGSTAFIQVERTQAVRDALDLVNKTKAPTKRAQLVTNLIVSNQMSQAEVDDFTRELRRRAGVQDVELLPETTWTVEPSAARPDALLGALSFTTEELRTALSRAVGAVVISWPSVTFHWGVMVTFTTEGGHHLIARSRDYAITETYMSS